MPMSNVNFDKYPSCQSRQVLDKNRERTNDSTCSILYWPFGVTLSIKPVSFLFIQFYIFHISSNWCICASIATGTLARISLFNSYFLSQ